MAKEARYNPKRVLHRGIIKHGMTPDSAVTTTLCRRVDNSQSDYNVADCDEQVNCKLCRRIIDNHQAYAHATKREIRR